MSSLKFTDGAQQVIFSGPTTTILTTYNAVAQAELELRSRGQILVDVDYTPGDETTIELLLEFSPDIDYPVTVPATGTDYYAYAECTAGVVSVLEFQLVAATGVQKLRIPIPLLHQERVMRLSVKRTGGSDAGAGSVGLRIVDDAHPVTSSFANKQP